MHPARRLTILAALAALLVGIDPSPSSAVSCEMALKPHYRCTAAYEGGGSSEYCVRMDAILPGDGHFYLIEDSGTGFYCTCAAKGKGANAKFGASSRDFFCGSDNLALTGKVSSRAVSGQGYAPYSGGGGIRTSFTCQPVPTCP